MYRERMGGGKREMRVEREIERERIYIYTEREGEKRDEMREV